MKGLQMLLKALGLELDANTLAMIQALIPQLPAKINEASAAINAALQNFDKRLQALEAGMAKLHVQRETDCFVFGEGLKSILGQLTDLKDGPRLRAIEEHLEGLRNGYTGRTSDTPGPTGAGTSGGDSGGTAGTGRRRRSE